MPHRQLFHFHQTVSLEEKINTPILVKTFFYPRPTLRKSDFKGERSFTLSPLQPLPHPWRGMVKGILWFTSLKILLKVNGDWLSLAMVLRWWFFVVLPRASKFNQYINAFGYWLIREHIASYFEEVKANLKHLKIKHWLLPPLRSSQNFLQFMFSVKYTNILRILRSAHSLKNIHTPILATVELKLGENCLSYRRFGLGLSPIWRDFPCSLPGLGELLLVQMA